MQRRNLDWSFNYIRQVLSKDRQSNIKVMKPNPCNIDSAKEMQKSKS